MATDTVTLPNVQVQGNLLVAGTLPSYPRASLEPDTNQIIAIPLSDWRVWDAVATNLPGTSSADDLGYVTGTHGTSGSYIGTSDLKTAGSTTRYARALVVLPPEYVAASTVSLRFSAGNITTVADTTATLNVDVREVSRVDGTVGSNLYAGAALDIRSTTFAEKQFALTSAALTAGDTLDIKVTMIINDAATGTAVIGAFRTSEIYTTIKG